MPELAEVEVARRRLTDWTAQRRISAVDVHDTQRMTGDVAGLVGSRVAAWERHGKLLLGRLSGGAVLLSHLGMTGKWVADPAADRSHQRLVLRFVESEPSSVAFLDTRRFGFCRVVPAAEVPTDASVAALGPDAWEHPWTGAELADVVGRRSVVWKQALMEQGRIAGLGNIAVCEMGWRAGVHPHRSCASLTEAEWERLVTAMRAHLAYLLEEEDVDEIQYLSEKAASNPFYCYGRAGQHCARCEAAIVRAVRHGRPSFWCPVCQQERR